MDKIILSDTSCLILLDKIGELELLRKLFSAVIITPEIAEEYNQPLPDWIKTEASENKSYQAILSISLDKGESSAIALCLEKSNPLLIIDDLKGRRFAQNLGIKVAGTLGVFVLAKRKNLIPSIIPLLGKIKKTDFRFSKSLEQTVLSLCNEG